MAEAAIVAAKAAAAWLAKEGVKQAIVKIALQALAAAVIGAATSKSNAPRPQGTLIDMDLASDAPRRVQIGRRGNGGVLVDWFTSGAKNERLYQIIYLGEGPMGPLRSVSSGGREIWSGTLNHGQRVQLTELGQSYVTYYDGRPGQKADTLLNTRNGAYKLSSVGAGCAYVIVELRFDTDSVPYPPDMFFENDGTKFYDRRKDTTAGGAGSHRIYDPNTWEVSTNPQVVLDHYQLGRYHTALDARPHFGIGLKMDELPFDRVLSQGNACDELVSTSTSAQKRYEANGFLFADRAHKDNILDLCRAMNARPADFGGRVSVVSGEAKVPVMTLAEGDIIEGIPETYEPKRSWGELLSGVRGTYQDKLNNYQPIDYPEISNTQWTADDGGETKIVTLNLEMETDVERAQRLALLYAKRERRQATLTGVYVLKAIELEEGDWFIRTGGKFGAGKVFEVIGSPSLNPETLSVTVQSFEVDASDSAWTSTDAAIPDTSSPDGTTAIPRIQPPALTISPVIDISASGVKVPVAIFTNAAFDDEIPPTVEIEVFPNDGTGAPTGSGIALSMPAGALTVKTSPLLPSEGYVARWRGTFGERVSDWSGWSAFTAASEFVAGAIVGQGPGATAPDLISFDSAAGASLAQAQSDIASLTASLANSVSALALLDSELDSETSSRIAAISQVASDLVQEVADRTAGDGLNAQAIIDEATTRESEDSALAGNITSLDARVDGVDSTIISNDAASADRDAALSTSIDVLSADFEVADVEREANSISELHPEYQFNLENNTSHGWGVIRATATVDGEGMLVVPNAGAWGYITKQIALTDPEKWDYVVVKATLGPETTVPFELCLRWLGANSVQDDLLPIVPIVQTHDDETVFVFRVRGTGLGGVFWETETLISRLFLHTFPRIAADNSFTIKEVALAKAAPGGGALEAGALIVKEATARATAVEAVATDLTLLTGRMGDAEADILTEATARADGDSANAALVTALDARVGTNEADITSAEQAIADETSARASEITTLGASVSTNAAELDDVEADIAAIEGDVQTNMASVGTLTQAIADEASARATDVSTLNASIGALDGDLTAAEASIQQVGAAAVAADAAQAQQITTISARVDDAESDILGNAADITSAEQAIADEASARATSVSNLTATVSTISSDLDDAEAEIATAQGAISTNTADISAAEQAIADETSARATDVSTLTASVLTVSSDLDLAESALAIAEADLLSAQNDINSTQADLSLAEAAVAAAEADITALEGDVQTNMASVGTLTQAIADETGARAAAVTTLEAEVDGIEASVTTNATAIAGVDGKLEATYGIAVDGTGNASIVLLSDGSTLGSAIILSATEIVLDGDVIINGTLTTESLAVGAVTTREIQQNNGSQSMVDGVWFAAAQFNFLSVGIGVEMRASGILKNAGFSPGGAGTFEYRLKRGGTVLLTGTVPRVFERQDYGNNVYRDEYTGFFGFDFNDLPASGTYTYSLEVLITGSTFTSGETLSIEQSFFSGREFKR
jgi:predicted  nucleic acid-binding Zn-ribbon protein